MDNDLLGKFVYDPVTSFKGLAVARCTRLHGAPTIRVQPCGITDNGGTIDPEWFEESQLKQMPPVKGQPGFRGSKTE